MICCNFNHYLNQLYNWIRTIIIVRYDIVNDICSQIESEIDRFLLQTKFSLLFFKPLLIIKLQTIINSLFPICKLTVNVKIRVLGCLLQNGNHVVQNDFVDDTQIGCSDVFVHKLEQAGFNHFMKFVDVCHLNECKKWKQSNECMQSSADFQ